MYNKNGRWLLNVHVRYKPPSHLRILIQSGGFPRKCSHQKNFKDLVVLGRGFNKGTIIQDINLKYRFYCDRHSLLIRKGDVMWEYVHVPRQSLSSIWTGGNMVYIQDQMNQTISLANPLLWTKHPGTPSIWPHYRSKRALLWGWKGKKGCSG